MAERNLGNKSAIAVGDEKVDEVLLGLMGAGDEAALAMFYNNRSRLVYSLALNIVKNTSDAEEITEEVFLKVWDNAGKFDSARGSVMAWVTTITRRLAIDRTRAKQYKDRMKEVQFESSTVADGDGQAISAGFDDVAAGVEAREVRNALDRLSETHRKLIYLSYYDGMSHSQISERLNTPLGTVKTRIREAVIQLRGMLRDDEPQRSI